MDDIITKVFHLRSCTLAFPLDGVTEQVRCEAGAKVGRQRGEHKGKLASREEWPLVLISETETQARS